MLKHHISPLPKPKKLVPKFHTFLTFLAYAALPEFKYLLGVKKSWLVYSLCLQQSPAVYPDTVIWQKGYIYFLVSFKSLSLTYFILAQLSHSNREEHLEQQKFNMHMH